MTPTRFLLVFTLALISLLALQGVWLYSTYELKSKEIKQAINNLLGQALEKEANVRFVEAQEVEAPDGTRIPVATFDGDEEDGKYENVTSYLYRAVQSFSFELGVPFDIELLDSIYSSLLKENKLPLKYEIIYTDSLDNILEKKGEEIDKGYKTDAFPIVYGSKAQAIVEIPTPVVLRNMAGILAVSLLIMILIIVLLVYETRSYVDERAINQLREDFTNGLIHDLKTPISSIHTVLDHIERGSMDKNPQMRDEFVRIGIEQTLNVQAMVNQILTVAQTDKKELNLNKQEINLPEIIDVLIRKFSVKREGKDKKITFSKEIHLDNTIVFADPLYLSNAISNLIDNAVKYSGESVNIHIDCSAGDEQVFIKIKDNGFGISSKDQLKIFERFERGAEIKRKHASGFGLGLSYVKKVIEAHGGVVAISSEEKKGSEFTITLPIVLTDYKEEIIEEEEIIEDHEDEENKAIVC